MNLKHVNNNKERRAVPYVMKIERKSNSPVFTSFTRGFSLSKKSPNVFRHPLKTAIKRYSGGFYASWRYSRKSAQGSTTPKREIILCCGTPSSVKQPQDLKTRYDIDSPNKKNKSFYHTISTARSFTPKHSSKHPAAWNTRGCQQGRECQHALKQYQVYFVW